MKFKKILITCLIALLTIFNRTDQASAQSIEANIPVTGYIMGDDSSANISDGNDGSVDNGNDATIPNTGDEFNIEFYSLLLLGSLGVFLFLLLGKWYNHEESLQNN